MLKVISLFLLLAATLSARTIENAMKTETRENLALRAMLNISDEAPSSHPQCNPGEQFRGGVTIRRHS